MAQFTNPYTSAFWHELQRYFGIEEMREQFDVSRLRRLYAIRKKNETGWRIMDLRESEYELMCMDWLSGLWLFAEKVRLACLPPPIENFNFRERC